MSNVAGGKSAKMATVESRNFALREQSGSESSVFSGKQPRQAALKAARRLPEGDTESTAERYEIRLREKGTKKIHIYEGWAWKKEVPDDSPAWLGDEVTEANVSKQGTEHIEEL